MTGVVKSRKNDPLQPVCRFNFGSIRSCPARRLASLTDSFLRLRRRCVGPRGEPVRTLDSLPLYVPLLTIALYALPSHSNSLFSSPIYAFHVRFKPPLPDASHTRTIKSRGFSHRQTLYCTLLFLVPRVSAYSHQSLPPHF